MATTLYHATQTIEVAWAIEDDGFRGNDVWDLHDVVFVADKPLPGFGNWGNDVWVAVEVPEDLLPTGDYGPEKACDDDQYGAACYAFPATVINRFPRRIVGDCE